MSKFLKKYWFVGLVVLLFVCAIGYYIYDTNKDKLRGKSSGGEDVVYSINGQDKTVSAFYDDLYKASGSSTATQLFEMAVADESAETTDDMKTTADTFKQNVISGYESSYGSSYESYLLSALKSAGYSSIDDLTTYSIRSQKIQQIIKDYAKANFTDLKIRDVSYILIKFTDSANVTDTPTADEQARMQAVDDALASGTSFADTATAHSEDTSTASAGGVYGLIDVNTTGLDETFLTTALSLDEGETSGWVKSDNFGYFKIMCTAATTETLESSYTQSANEANNSSSTDPYVNLASSSDTTLSGKAIWAKAQEIGVDFKGNTDLETAVKTQLGVADAADSTSTDASASPEATADATSTAEATAGTN
jgi:foldase protein PrsA